MSIVYSLHKNHLLNSPEGSYRAIVHFKGAVNMEKVIDRMMEREPGITREVAAASVRLYHQTIYAYLLDGQKVVTPFGMVGVSVKGTFERQTDSFDHTRHSIEPTLTPGSELRRIIRDKSQAQQQEANSKLPNPIEYLDLASSQYDSLITPGRVAQLNGYRLKFDEADPAQGLFFIGADGSESRSSLIAKNTPRQLIFETPAGLAPGAYSLEIRSMTGGSRLRVGRLPAILTVA